MSDLAYFAGNEWEDYFPMPNKSNRDRFKYFSTYLARYSVILEYDKTYSERKKSPLAISTLDKFISQFEEDILWRFDLELTWNYSSITLSIRADKLVSKVINVKLDKEGKVIVSYWKFTKDDKLSKSHHLRWFSSERVPDSREYIIRLIREFS